MKKTTEEAQTLEQNKELRDEIQEKLQKNIDTKPLIKSLPSYANDNMSINTDEDLTLNLILINSMNLRINRPDDKCDFLVPTFIPAGISETPFFKLLFYLYHLTAEQADQLAQVLVKLFGSDDGLLFDYFVNAGFPNIYQNFISINHCETASSIIKSLISISKNDSKAIRLTINLLSKFVLSCFTFLQEFRNYITFGTLFDGVNEINKEIKKPFIDSFRNSVLFLTSHHITTLKYFIQSLPDHQAELINKITDGLLSNIKRMDQYLTTSFVLTPEEVSDDILEIINDLEDKCGYNYPNIEQSVFYNQKMKLSLTRADVFILHKIDENIKEGPFNIYIKKKIQLPEMSMNDAFSIFFKEYQIESDPNKQNKPLFELANVDQNQVNKWEAVKDLGNSICIDPISLLDLSKEEATDSLKVLEQEIAANSSMQDKLRKRMPSIIYIKQIEKIILQMRKEIFNSYAKIDYACTTKSKITKWEIFSGNFLRRNLARYFKDSRYQYDIKPEDVSIILTANLNIENYESLVEFVDFFTKFQNQLIATISKKFVSSTAQVLPNQSDRNSYNKYIIMFKWLQNLLEIEAIYSFTSIKVEDKNDKKIKFDTKEDTNMIKPYNKFLSLLSFVNEGIIKESSPKHANYFSNEFIASLIILFNEMYNEVCEWNKAYQEESMKDFNDEEEDEEEEINSKEYVDCRFNVQDIIFSKDLKFPVMYRILNELDKSKVIKKIPSQYSKSLTEMLKCFQERKK